MRYRDQAQREVWQQRTFPGKENMTDANGLGKPDILMAKSVARSKRNETTGEPSPSR
jgi:hypothetical protein